MNIDEAYNEYKLYLRSRERSFSTFAALAYGFRGVIGSMPEGDLNDVKPQQVDAYVAAEVARGTKPQSINPRMSTLRRFFSWCLQRGYIRANPMAAWEPLRKAETPPRRDFTRAEVEAVLRQEFNPVDRVRWLFYFNTGRRAMEGARLLWEWVDLAKRKILIPPHANKSGRYITIHINEALYGELRDHWHNHGHKYGGLVFPPITGSGLLRKFKRALRRAQLDPDQYCLHSARHTTAMELYQRSGHNLELVRKVLGHASIATTQKYLHVDDEETREGMEALNFY